MRWQYKFETEGLDVSSRPRTFAERCQMVAAGSMGMDASIQHLDQQADVQLGRMASVYNLRKIASALRAHPEDKRVLMGLINSTHDIDRLLQLHCDLASAEDIACAIERVIHCAEEAEKEEEKKTIQVEINVNVGEGEVEKTVEGEPLPTEPPSVPDTNVSTEDNTGTVIEIIPIPAPAVTPPPATPDTPTPETTPVTPPAPEPTQPSTPPAPPQTPATTIPAPASDEPVAAPDQPPASTPPAPVVPPPAELPQIVPPDPATVPVTPAEVTAEAVEAIITEDEPDGDDDDDDELDPELIQLDETLELDIPAETVDGETATEIVVSSPQPEPTISTEGLSGKALIAVGQILTAIAVISYVMVETWLKTVKNILLAARKANAGTQNTKVDAAGFANHKVRGMAASQYATALATCDKIGVLLHSNIVGGFVKVDIEAIIAQMRSMGNNVDDNGTVHVRPEWMARNSTYGDLGYTPEKIRESFRLVDNVLVNCLKTLEAFKQAKRAAKASMLETKAKKLTGRISDTAYAEKRAELKRRIVVFGKLYRAYVLDSKRLALFYIAACKRMTMIK